ncbi:MAG: 4Fe-4S dicluster domain-containing protein [Candidatus Aminicenantes bacterium]|nr:4Fe-4S dicluster domain-containing protein [Candidatus Aminicenantes bacterium]
MAKIDDLKDEARKLLQSGKLKYIIGYGAGSNGWPAAPLFIKKPEDVDKLIWNPTCVHNLVRFLVDEKRRRGREKQPDNRPVGVVVKGCDSRAIVVLLQEKFIERNDVYILGVSCEKAGVVDDAKLAKKLAGKRAKTIEVDDRNRFVITADGVKTEVPVEELLAERCLECRANFPVIYDLLSGEKPKRQVDKPFGSIEKVESLPVEERWKFWKEQLDKCIRCYACRSACPMCYCDECVVDSINLAVSADTTADEKARRIKWIQRSAVPSENIVYHLVRAIHLGGRCIDCGECERVCPLDIPLRFLNKKLEKEAKELFDYEVGFDPERPALISSFRDEDPQAFIR